MAQWPITRCLCGTGTQQVLERKESVYDDNMLHALPSPSHRRVNAVMGLDSPSRSKRRRIDDFNPDLLMQTDTISNHYNVDINFPGALALLDQPLPSIVPSPAVPPSPPSVAPSPAVPPSLSPIKAKAHQICLDMQTQLRQEKGADDSYPRHIKNYVNFWNDFQDSEQQNNPAYQRIEAHPILAEKVALFLDHEIRRTKRNNRGQEISGTSVGKEHIKQVISALQNYMALHQHEDAYKNCPETFIPLRSQQVVKVFEVSAAANEPKRIMDAHILKSKGTSADTYTTDEMKRMSNWTLKAFGPAKAKTHLGIRDRAMLLLATNSAFRGDSIRRILWSDIFSKLLPLPLASEDNDELSALVILADQAKTNSVGRVDEHGLFRHRLPELCGYGGIAFYFFSHFHILQKPPPTFSPDFSDSDHGEYGRRDWYAIHLFPGGKGQPGGTEPMTYENHRDCVLNIHRKCDIDITAVTHGGRFYTADKAGKYGATGLDIKALGKWKTGDAYSEVYNRALPTKAMLASAMFNPDNPKAYILPREILEPPPILLATLFPWVESEQENYARRVQEHGRKGVDHSLKHFLVFLIGLRKIILQDAAVLFAKHPGYPLWNFEPFNTQEFRNFSASSTEILEAAEKNAKRALERLPETVATSMHGILKTIDIKQQRDREELNARFQYLEGLISNSSRGKSKVTKCSSKSSSLGVNTQERSQCFMEVDPTPQTPDPAQDPLPGASVSPPPHQTLLIAQKNVLSTPPKILSEAHPGSDSKWPSDLVAFQSNFVLSEDNHNRDRQVHLIRDLIQKYGRERINCHQFEWVTSSRPSIPDEWLPIYIFNVNVKSVTDVWTEWSDGLDGCLSVRQLSEGWLARWKRGVNGQKTESTRRSTIIKLITSLSEKPNWNVQLALKFLEEKYTIPSEKGGRDYLLTLRSFITYLQNGKEGAKRKAEIFEAASKYC